MKIPLYVLIDSKNKQKCNNDCPFLHVGDNEECLLFHSSVHTVTLDNGKKTRTRCKACREFTSHVPFGEPDPKTRKMDGL